MKCALKRIPGQVKCPNTAWTGGPEGLCWEHMFEFRRSRYTVLWPFWKLLSEREKERGLIPQAKTLERERLFVWVE